MDRSLMTPMPRGDLLATFLKPNPVVLAAVWLFVVVHFVARWATLGDVFNDTDDAMRLVEVRDFLAGQGWFDLHQYRLDPPADLPMHWSRLVDLPIALLIRLAELVVPTATAEKAAMYLWPTLVLIPALAAVRRIACRIGGDWAALPALYLIATCAPVIGQFMPGRIDHHNAQIALTLWLIAFAFDPPSPARGLRLAATSAVMMAVGMETLPFVLFVAVFVVVGWVRDTDRGEAQVYGLGLAAGTAAMMAATMPPGDWSRGACDALSANYVVLALVGGLGLAAGARVGLQGWAVRLAFVGAVGGVALFAFALPDPACLRGPYGQILPEVRTVWIDGVTEIQPWHVFFQAHHVDALVALIPPVLAAIIVGRAAVVDRDFARHPAFWLLAASVAAATAIGFVQVRTIVYADILSVPLVAAAIGRFAAANERMGRSATVVVLAGTVLASSSLATLVLGKVGPASWKSDDAASTIGSAATTGNGASGAAGTIQPPCMTLSNYAAAARLERGFVLAEIDLGPMILAATPHSVIAAPYHRMQRGILDGHHMLRAAPEEALAAMEARGIDYVLICTASPAAATVAEHEPASLLAAVMQGRVPAGLEPVVSDGVVRVYRRGRTTSLADLRGSLTFH